MKELICVGVVFIEALIAQCFTDNVPAIHADAFAEQFKIAPVHIKGPHWIRLTVADDEFEHHFTAG
ncbi:MAG: hypothetical protein BWY95_00716 [Bacteroidetes bacterium ADurb.BinA104]|nr:MAG: hypothetical protein BWY95_00716 [Bacteroidetes bacterium ADurb.BinA104]